MADKDEKPFPQKPSSSRPKTKSAGQAEAQKGESVTGVSVKSHHSDESSGSGSKGKGRGTATAREVTTPGGPIEPRGGDSDPTPPDSAGSSSTATPPLPRSQARKSAKGETPGGRKTMKKTAKETEASIEEAAARAKPSPEEEPIEAAARRKHEELEKRRTQSDQVPKAPKPAGRLIKRGETGAERAATIGKEMLAGEEKVPIAGTKKTKVKTTKTINLLAPRIASGIQQNITERLKLIGRDKHAPWHIQEISMPPRPEKPTELGRPIRIEANYLDASLEHVKKNGKGENLKAIPADLRVYCYRVNVYNGSFSEFRKQLEQKRRYLSKDAKEKAERLKKEEQAQKERSEEIRERAKKMFESVQSARARAAEREERDYQDPEPEARGSSGAQRAEGAEGGGEGPEPEVPGPSGAQRADEDLWLAEPCLPKEINYKIFWEMLKRSPEEFGSQEQLYNYIYDGMFLLFSLKQINFSGNNAIMNGKAIVLEKEMTEPVTESVRKCLLVVYSAESRQVDINQGTIAQIPVPGGPFAVRSPLQILSVLMDQGRTCPDAALIPNSGNFFVPERGRGTYFIPSQEEERLLRDLGNLTRVWNGLFSALTLGMVRPTQPRLMLNIDMLSTAFFKMGAQFLHLFSIYNGMPPPRLPQDNEARLDDPPYTRFQTAFKGGAKTLLVKYVAIKHKMENGKPARSQEVKERRKFQGFGEVPSKQMFDRPYNRKKISTGRITKEELDELEDRMKKKVAEWREIKQGYKQKKAAAVEYLRNEVRTKGSEETGIEEINSLNGKRRFKLPEFGHPKHEAYRKYTETTYEKPLREPWLSVTRKTEKKVKVPIKYDLKVPTLPDDHFIVSLELQSGKKAWFQLKPKNPSDSNPEKFLWKEWLSVGDHASDEGIEGARNYPNLKTVQLRTMAEKGGRDDIFVLIQCCWVQDPQMYRGDMNKQMTAEMIKVAAVPAQIRREKILALASLAKVETDPFMNHWGMHLRMQLVEVCARVLKAPRIFYREQRSDRPIEAPIKEGVWKIPDAGPPGNKNLIARCALAPKHRVIRVGCIWISRKFSQCTLENHTRFQTSPEFNVFGRYAEALLGTMKQFGIQVAEDNVFGRVVGIGEADDVVREAVKFCTNRLTHRPGEVDLLLVVVPAKPHRSYPIVKQMAEIGDPADPGWDGVMTQCATEKTAKDCKGNVLTNICLKLCMKLGGVCHRVQPSDPRQQNPVFSMMENSLILGLDVVHPGRLPGDEVPVSMFTENNKDFPSISAVVGNEDGIAGLWMPTITIQKRCQEYVNYLSPAFAQRLLAFFEKTGKKPNRIIMYRDGVSEGEFAKIVGGEVAAIKRACESVDEDYQPAITFIVCQKRHHTKFFAVDARDRVGRAGNIPPGTTVDRDVVSSTNFDFYQCAHFGIQGTSKPTHYHVLHNEGTTMNGYKVLPMEPDQIYEMTYILCHQFSRCTRSVSIPAPVYYADIACARAKHHLNAMNSLERSGGSSEGSGGGYPGGSRGGYDPIPTRVDAEKVLVQIDECESKSTGTGSRKTDYLDESGRGKSPIQEGGRDSSKSSRSSDSDKISGEGEEAQGEQQPSISAALEESVSSGSSLIRDPRFRIRFDDENEEFLSRANIARLTDQEFKVVEHIIGAEGDVEACLDRDDDILLSKVTVLPLVLGIGMYWV